MLGFRLVRRSNWPRAANDLEIIAAISMYRLKCGLEKDSAWPQLVFILTQWIPHQQPKRDRNWLSQCVVLGFR